MLRYARHIILPEVGGKGQQRLREAGVLVVGAGGLGSPAAMYLAAAGVGRLGIVDSDEVALSDLHRQLLHATPDVGRPKVVSAAETLHALNPNVEVITYPERLTCQNAERIVREYDVVIDGSDNFATRYLVNDLCFFLRKPDVFGSVFQFEGQATIFHPAAGGPCYRCLFSEPPPRGEIPACAEAGVLNVLPGVIGTLQAAEALKLILGIGELLIGRLVLWDALQGTFRQVRIASNRECALCGERPSITQLAEYEEFCAPARGDQLPPPRIEVRPGDQS